ncbi:conserved hypothetical protein [Bathymodiolus platifrons methanotrophic gill symbiont]|uniref:hypothetical protein n=1 Tax=Bathymodiolus platifrons methanotrophic gill symbiont TaxID=113268 RepID=UPI000B41F430|nr:hypothetical protein [Bathymodiolus platifrons methanotrophic gill symbiont]TXK96513.1 hypothetical protein BMR11_11700 [Methylococcaceae bacterium CS5]TXK99425.1 hypothetical protein BMR10_00040 [Methylococcaceae bacterium CS4]TXL01991.1 hypothetical protein BMR09_17585 [Methylococcaceae bacterium CS3]TXL05370.1 hypothetical protein BMR07_10010 [Methylococcaceae bacterium CS1]TXL10115.1 hypothetical protein BMR08_10635 [Methylococcaceae bacterium CS2]TXL13891.1 hypothetical protein BMR05_
MNKKIISLSALAISAALVTGCSTLSKQPAEIEPIDTETVVMNNYPTRDRVDYVFNCIAKHGGKLDYVTQYACGCKIDKIAEKLTFAEYEAAATFTMLRSTPGENGAVFRDPAHSKDLRTRLKEAEAYAESSCFIK